MSRSARFSHVINTKNRGEKKTLNVLLASGMGLLVLKTKKKNTKISYHVFCTYYLYQKAEFRSIVILSFSVL